jgi:hypothetical protein
MIKNLFEVRGRECKRKSLCIYGTKLLNNIVDLSQICDAQGEITTVSDTKKRDVCLVKCKMWKNSYLKHIEALKVITIRKLIISLHN